MENKFLFWIFTFILLFFIVCSNNVNAEEFLCNPTIKLISQDPNPAVPNDYVKVVFEVSNLDHCDGFSVRLNPKYPFSLDTNDSGNQTIEINPYAAGYKNAWSIPYKIRIDSDAFDGDYNLTLQYKEGINANFDYSLESKEFNITIKDSRTKFDAVIQETSGNDVSIAIANVGKYTANSVVVRIPEQDSFSVTGTDGQMVGNLESGDYTIVGFSLSQKSAMQQGVGKKEILNNISQQSNKLKFDIYYTDNLGERRIVNMDLSLKIGNSSIISANNFIPQASTSFISKNKWIFIIIFIIVGYILYRKYPEKTKEMLRRIYSSLKELTGKKKQIISENKIPDWVRNSKEKENKK